jgi:hypothetical protein
MFFEYQTNEMIITSLKIKIKIKIKIKLFDLKQTNEMNF